MCFGEKNTWKYNFFVFAVVFQVVFFFLLIPCTILTWRFFFLLVPP